MLYLQEIVRVIIERVFMSYKGEIFNYITSKGYKPLEIKDNSIVVVEDKYGYRYEMTYQKFKNGKSFFIVDKNNPFSTYNANLYLINNNIPLKLLTDKVENSSSQKLKFMDSKGHIFYRTWHKMLSNNKNCPECSKLMSRKEPLGKEFIINQFKFRGYDVVDAPNKVLINTLLSCVDKDGYKYKIKYNTLCTKNNHEKFSLRNPYTIDNIKKYLENNNIQIKLLSKKYTGSNKPLLWECGCGNTFNRSWDTLYGKKSYKCLTCSYVQSNNENIIEQYLLNLNIEYIKEYKFKDCVYFKPLPFDFYLPKYNICIEVQGEQHYQPIRFGGISEKDAKNNFILQQKKDNIKVNYCNNKKIKLCIISYNDIKSDKYKNIIHSIITE